METSSAPVSHERHREEARIHFLFVIVYEDTFLAQGFKATWQQLECRLQTLNVTLESFNKKKKKVINPTLGSAGKLQFVL